MNFFHTTAMSIKQGDGFDTILDYDVNTIAGGDQFGDNNVHRDANGKLYVDVGTGLVVDGSYYVQNRQVGNDASYAAQLEWRVAA